MKKRIVQTLLLGIILIISTSFVLAGCWDGDGDGYGITFTGTGADCIGEDCNDNDFYVHPGSTVCVDGIDSDCDGEINEVDCSICIDSDGDNYGEGCSLGETDCDDSDANVNEGEDETTFNQCTDNKDNDCDGLYDGDDIECAVYYPTGSIDTTPTGGPSGTSGCELTQPLWAILNESGKLEYIQQTIVGEDLVLTVANDNDLCDDEDIIFTVYDYEDDVQLGSEIESVFGDLSFLDKAIGFAQAPTSSGQIYFTAESSVSIVTSDPLLIITAEEEACQIQWDCSSIKYGSCDNGIRTREVCPGYEGTLDCCEDEDSCLCLPIAPTETCLEYTYARPKTERTCTSGTYDGSTSDDDSDDKDKDDRKKFTGLFGDDEDCFGEECEGKGFPWLMVILIIFGVLLLTGGIVFFFLMKKPVVKVPATLINYVKAARAKKVPDVAIKAALQRSGWKPEQIKAAFKQASKPPGAAQTAQAAQQKAVAARIAQQKAMQQKARPGVRQGVRPGVRPGAKPLVKRPIKK